MKICIKENEFNPSLLYQKWCSEELATEMGYTIVEVDEKYADCCFEDFNEDLTFSVDKYNARKQRESNQLELAELQPELDKLTEDLIQAQAGAIIPDLEERKARFQVIHNRIREIKGKEPRKYFS